MALIDKKAIPKENVRLFSASKDTDLCTFEGMKERFLDQARQVGKEGLFIFHFSGHGLKVGNEWGLAPADFDYTDATFLTGSLLNRWLHEADCKAQHILFTLDCCFAGGLAEELTSRDIDLRPGLYVLSACTAFETSLVIGPLGHSIFAYFLAYALRVFRYPPGKLPISHIFEECGALCMSLSSLLISYNPTYGLKFGTMQPQLRYFDLSTTIGNWVEESLKARTPIETASYHPTLGRYAFVLKYYKSERGTQQNVLCELCLKWLDSISDDGSPLGQLYKRGLLKDEILRAAVCSLMWSIASIQMVNDRKTVNDPNMFLVAFLHVAATFDCFHRVVLTLQHLKEGWEFYQAVVETNKLDDSGLQQLYREIVQDLKVVNKQESVDSPLELEGSGEVTDSIVMKTIQVCALFIEKQTNPQNVEKCAYPTDVHRYSPLGSETHFVSIMCKTTIHFGLAHHACFSKTIEVCAVNSQ